jgi:transcription elongation GreA/GreB family factor
VSVAFRRESDDEHLEPKFELPIPPGPNLVTPAGRALLETQLAAADDTGAVPIKRDLRYWKTRRATAIETPPPADGTAGFGSVVTIRLAGKQRHIAIVGDDEADPAADRIAFSAPLARAIIGAEVGEMLPFNGREDAIEVLAID